MTDTNLDREETRDGFRFRGGHVALDLTATLLGRLKETPRDLLARPDDVTRWLKAAGLRCSSTSPNDRTLSAARALREAIYGLALSRRDGRAPSESARKTINGMARAQAASPEIDTKGQAQYKGDADRLLAFIAREAVALLGGDAAERIRQCEGEGCAVLFLDTSRSGDRRWCSMAACGNRHKVAEFRRRKRNPS